MTASLGPLFQWVGINGPAVGYALHTELAGAPGVPLATYQDEDLTVPHANPIILNAYGAVGADVFFLQSRYRFVLKDPDGVPVATWDGFYPFSAGGGLRNLLINGSCEINQRAFAGGALAAGDYGFDRWRAASGGASVSVGGGVISLASGAIEQVIEAPRLAGETVTVSAEDASQDIAVTLAASGSGSGSVTGTISAGAGRQGVSLAVPGSATGHILVRTAVSSPTSFSRVQTEIGGGAKPFERHPEGVELLMCQRYFERTGGEDALQTFLVAQAITGDQARGHVPFAVRKRVAPTIVFHGPVTAWAIDTAGGAQLGAASVGAAFVTTEGFEFSFQGSSAGLVAGNAAQVRANNSTAASWAADAEFY